MSLYHIINEGEETYVEAGSYAAAVGLWMEDHADENNASFEPEVVVLLTDDPVIR